MNISDSKQGKVLLSLNGLFDGEASSESFRRWIASYKNRKTLVRPVNAKLLRDPERSRFMRSKAAADYLGVSEWTLRKLAHDGEIQFIQRTPRSPMLFDIADLDAWTKRNKRGSEG